MIIWKTCEASNCKKEFYIMDDMIAPELIVICPDCMETLSLMAAANQGPSTMTLEEYRKLVEDFYDSEDPDKGT